MSVNMTLLAAFVPTFFVVSVTPGMCMTLSLSLGITIGPRRALWMMWGELLGVALVALAAALGVAAVLLRYPAAFTLFKLLGGLYLGWLGVQLWRSRGRLAIQADQRQPTAVSRSQLAMQGLVTAVANPKGWAFLVALLPPFLDPGQPLAPQLAVLIGIMLILEFLCLQLYAHGGRSLRALLSRDNNVRLLNRVAGSLMIGVGLWLILD